MMATEDDITTPTTSTKMYTDDDFYDLYHPVFVRNLRFDAKLRPDLLNSSSSNTTAASSGSSSSTSSKQQQSSSSTSSSTSSAPPMLGDATTPLEQVHAFYDYWIHFSSWRDFTTQAMTDLQYDADILDNSESRFEKRFYQKEIDKRNRILKRTELTRIQTLVERAMEADPRLYVIFSLPRLDSFVRIAIVVVVVAVQLSLRILFRFDSIVTTLTPHNHGIPLSPN
jgi:hypothetical protein